MMTAISRFKSTFASLYQLDYFLEIILNFNILKSIKQPLRLLGTVENQRNTYITFQSDRFVQSMRQVSEPLQNCTDHPKGFPYPFERRKREFEWPTSHTTPLWSIQPKLFTKDTIPTNFIASSIFGIGLRKVSGCVLESSREPIFYKGQFKMGRLMKMGSLKDILSQIRDQMLGGTFL